MECDILQLTSKTYTKARGHSTYYHMLLLAGLMKCSMLCTGDLLYDSTQVALTIMPGW